MTTYQEMLDNARQKFNGSCKVCKVCDGNACKGEVPGMGGKGTGSSFTENIEALKKVKVNMRVLHDVDSVNTTVNLFGKNLQLPIMAAPITGTMLNMGGIVSELDYITPVVKGCVESGIYAMVGDTAVEQCLLDNLEVLKANDGDGIVIIKPWKNEVVIKKIKDAEKAGAFAVGIDIDACGLVTLAKHGKPVFPKQLEDIKELVNSTKLPFILKGIMTPDEALIAVEAGVDAIVVSNHGGRVQDCALGTATVLPEIAKVVKGKVKIFVDGGVRSGVDIFKMIALGADAVLIGRPFITASFGAEIEGVNMYISKLEQELIQTMILTGSKSIEHIDSSKIVY